MDRTFEIDLARIDAIANAWPKVAGPWLPPVVDSGSTRWPPCRKDLEGRTVVWDRRDLDESHSAHFKSPKVEIHDLAFPGDVGRQDAAKCESREEADEVLRAGGWLLLEESPTVPSLLRQLTFELRQTRQVRDAVLSAHGVLVEQVDALEGR